MSKVLKVRGVHKLEWVRVPEDDLWHYDIYLRPATVVHKMGRGPIAIIGRHTISIKSYRLLDEPSDGPRKRYRMVGQLIHTDDKKK